VKFVEVRKIYNDTIRQITKDKDEWVSFLKSASWNFKYNFDDQVLIYNQKPNATACAEMDDWNNKVKPKRWVNKNTKAITIFAKPNSEMPLRFVFDMADTHNNMGTAYNLWQVEEKYKESVIEALQDKFGEVNAEGKLEQAIILTSYNMVTENIQDYIATIKKYKAGTKLKDLEENEIESMLIPIVWSSVAYMMMTRCGINADQYINKDEFQFVDYFNTSKLTTILGNATSDIAEEGIKEIRETIKNLLIEEKNKNRTFAENLKQEYPNNENKEIGGINNEQDTIYETGGLLDSKYNNGGRENTNREIRSNAINISNDTQQVRVHDIEDGKNVEQTLDGDTRESNRDDSTDNRTNEENGWNNRELERNRPNEMGGLNEQLQSNSRATSSKGTDIQLKLSERKEYVYERNSKIENFYDDETINDIIRHSPDIKKKVSEIKIFIKENIDDDIKCKAFAQEIFGNAYTEYVINNNIRVGHKTYSNGLLLWKGDYLNRTEESFIYWSSVAEHLTSMVVLGELDLSNIEFPTEQEQINIITQAEVDKTSVFSFPQEIIDRALQNGSQKQEGKFRIYEQLTKSLSSKENADFLKYEYGEGGYSRVIAGSQIHEDHNAKGIKLTRTYDENAPTLWITWLQAEKRIRELISSDRYFNDKEKEKYEKWLDDKEKNIEMKVVETIEETPIKVEKDSLAKRINNFIKSYQLYNYPVDSPIYNTDEEDIAFIEADINDNLNVNDYINAMQKIEETLETEEQKADVREIIKELEEKLPEDNIYKLQDRVFIGIDEFEIININDKKVTVADVKFPLFMQEMDYLEFDRKAKQNPYNEHLKKSNRANEIEIVSKEETHDITSNIENEERKENVSDIETKDNTEEKLVIPKEKIKRKNRIEHFDLHPEIPVEERHNYKITDYKLGEGTPREKFSRNIQAIKVLKKCEDENRYATPEEQEILSQYIGWGGLPEAFEPNNTSWSKEYNELKSLLTEKEYKEAQESVLTAFYTPPVVINSMYKALENMGLKQGNILEPSCRSW